MIVRDIMTPDPVTTRDDTSIDDTAKLLTRYRITGLPVVDGNNKVIGIVSEFDLLSKQGQTVGEVMSRGIISVSSDTSVDIVSHLLTDHRIRRLPVIDADQLVGIVSRADIIRGMLVNWICSVCGEVVHSQKAPEVCPKCGTRESFSFSVPNPGD